MTEDEVREIAADALANVTLTIYWSSKAILQQIAVSAVTTVGSYFLYQQIVDRRFNKKYGYGKYAVNKPEESQE